MGENEQKALCQIKKRGYAGKYTYQETITVWKTIQLELGETPKGDERA